MVEPVAVLKKAAEDALVVAEEEEGGEAAGVDSGAEGGAAAVAGSHFGDETRGYEVGRGGWLDEGPAESPLVIAYRICVDCGRCLVHSST